MYAYDGSQLTYNDDGAGNRNFKLRYTLTAGTPYVIGIRMKSNYTASYTLNITSPNNTSLPSATETLVGVPSKVNFDKSTRFNKDIKYVRRGDVVGICEIGMSGINNERSHWGIIYSRSKYKAYTIERNASHTLKKLGTKKVGLYKYINTNEISYPYVSKDGNATDFQLIGLKKDGTLVSVNWEDYGQTDVEDWENIGFR